MFDAVARCDAGTIEVMRAKTKPPKGFELTPDILMGCEGRTRFSTGCVFAGGESVKYPG